VSLAVPAIPEVENNAHTQTKVDLGNRFVFPATSAQRRYWLLDQLLPGGNPALNMPIGLRWRGPLEPATLKLALNATVARHEALRTTFEADRKQLRQLITPILELDLSIDERNNFDASADEASFAISLSPHAFD